MSAKPIGHGKYGSIGHLPGSRLEHNHAKYQTGKTVGVDVGVQQGAADICTKLARKGDRIIVQEKLDGSNVSVCNDGGRLVALTRGGKLADSSKYEHHRLFSRWMHQNADLFAFIEPGERLCGEWLALAHGTIYKLPHAPFVAFDLVDTRQRLKTDDDPTGCRIPRLTFDAFMLRCSHLPTPHVLSDGGACSIERAISLLDPKHHGATEDIEGAVWRVEREGRVDILAKYVRPDKVDGCYLPEISGKEAIWNWHPFLAMPPHGGE